MAWDLNEKGDVRVCPLTGFQIGIFSGLAVAVRLDHARNPAELEKPSQSLQVGMSAAQAMRLAEDLIRAAETILRPPGDLEPS